MRLMVIYALFSISIVQQLGAMKNILTTRDQSNMAQAITLCLINDDYDMNRKVAMLNKECHKRMEYEYRPNKMMINTFKEKNKNNLYPVTGHVSWNRDFSKCAWCTVIDKGNKKNCALTLLYLDDKDSIIKQEYQWDNFHFPVFEDHIRPFFTKEGEVCFHGYGYKHAPFRMSQSLEPILDGYNAVFEYVLDVDGHAESRRCLLVLDRPKRTDIIVLIYIFNFPLLLKSLLQLKKGLTAKDESELVSYYSFERKDIIIPENYRFFKQHVAWKNFLDTKLFDYRSYRNITVYDDLLQMLRQDIEKRYKQQILEKVM